MVRTKATHVDNQLAHPTFGFKAFHLKVVVLSKVVISMPTFVGTYITFILTVKCIITMNLKDKDSRSHTHTIIVHTHIYINYYIFL